MVELHSNYTVEGIRDTVNGVVPSYHAFHETLELTRGVTDWFEMGLYTFTSIQPGMGYEWVGNHLRPRVRAPEEWHWPVGVSFSTEFGYQRRSFSESMWTCELRPIVDKQWGRWYWAVNPAFEWNLSGHGDAAGVGFSPSAKISYQLFKWIAPGIEYYTDLGPLTHLDSFGNQGQQIMPVLDVDLSPKWEINFGVGIGLNHSTDHLLIKLILGRKF